MTLSFTTRRSPDLRLRLDACQRLVVKARRRQRQLQQLEGARTGVGQGGQVDGDVIAVSVEADRDRLVAHGILEIVGFQVAGALGEIGRASCRERVCQYV